MNGRLRRWLWRCAARLHHLDFALFLPYLARLPLPLGYALAGVRGRINALTGRDWRSMGLGFRHIHRQSLAGYALLQPSASRAIELKIRPAAISTNIIDSVSQTTRIVFFSAS